MNVSGQQVLLVNEFDKASSFYKKFTVEAKIRALAEAFPNSYSLAFFACCREIYDKTRHQGFLKGTVVIEPIVEEEDVETKEMVGARGNVTVNLALKRQNFALCFGCKPS